MLILAVRMLVIGRSREGAWIEIAVDMPNSDAGEVAPVRERGLKLHFLPKRCFLKVVAPVRERGLKLCHFLDLLLALLSLP